MNPWTIGISGALTAAAGLAAYGAAWPRAQLFGRSVYRTPAPDRLALTFDDGPNPAVTPRLLELLDRYNAKATFFVIGKFARREPGLVRELARRGHIVGNHTETHPNLFRLGPAKIREEMQLCREAMEGALGESAKWFRPPFGFRNPWVVRTARELGMTTVMWTLIPGDWRAKPADWLIERMQPVARRLESLRARNPATGSGYGAGGHVLCLHDGGHRTLNADRSATLAALEYWLPRWRDLGLEFVTIEDAVNASAR